MTLASLLRPAAVAAVLALAVLGCSHDTRTLAPWPLPTDPVVFDDALAPGVDYQAFLNSKLDAISVDPAEHYSGTAALKVTIPTSGWSGGALTTRTLRNLSGYDAVTFWAKASRPAALDVAGLGNDNTGTSKFEAWWKAIPLTTTWKKYVIPVPLPEKLGIEGGLFYFAEGPEGGMGYTVWFDDIRFERVGTITNPRPTMTTQTVSAAVGAAVNVQGTKTVFAVDGVDQTIEHLPGYFTYVSSNPSVAAFQNGAIRVLGAGSTTITATLGGVEVLGTLTVNATALPTTAAPAPTLPAADVISLFSNAYTSVPVDTWSATWDAADVSDVQIGGNHTKAYNNLVYAGIEFTSNVIDASAMTHFSIDVWVPAGNVFRIKLVDFGADGVYGGGDDRESELAFDAGSTPALVRETWVRLDIPLAAFTSLTSTAHLAQLILSGDTPTVYVDNVLFHR